MMAVTILRVLTVIHVGLLQRLCELAEQAEIAVVAGLLFSQHGMQRMVEILVPLRINTIAATPGNGNHARVVNVVLRDQDQVASSSARQLRGFRRELLEYGKRRRIHNRVSRVQPQAVD